MRGIVCNAGKGNLDESPRAYKDIFEVMDLQSSLVDVVEYVKPIIVVKG
jgi:tRNA-splicing ligase RtcB